jgi:hypothetical protein
MALCTAPVLALGPAWRLPAGTIDAIGAHRMWLHGRAASLRTFDAPGDIADVAVALIAQVSTPPRLQAMPDGLLIAGVDGTVHWVIRLIASGAVRTQGSLSAMDMNHTPTLTPLSWQPAGITVRMDVAADEGDVRVRQQVWTDGNPAGALHRRTCGALRQHGWRPDDMGGTSSCAEPLWWPATTSWRRDGASLTLVIDRHPPGSSAFVLQTEPLVRRGFGLPWPSLADKGQERTGETQ